MQLRKILQLVFVVIAISQPAAGQTEVVTSAGGRIKYISNEAIYVDLGKGDGIAIGDSLFIIRGKSLIALVQVKFASASSASCIILKSKSAPEVGDKVIRRALSQEPAQRKKAKRVQRRIRPKKHKKKNRIRGYISTQNYWKSSIGGSSISSFRPGIRARIRVENIAGTNFKLSLRQRSRMYRQTLPAGIEEQGIVWSHNLYEMSLRYESPDSPIELGVGRVYSPHIRGIGLVDGAYFSTKVLPMFRVGIAAGLEPDNLNTGRSQIRQKFGTFVAFEAGSYEKQKLSSTLAVSASYEAGEINREFLYLSNNYYLKNRLTLYQSVEVDINREWRKSSEGSSLSFTNFFMNANLTLHENANMYFGFDARRNIRVYTYFNLADSLFDNRVHKGLNSGIRLRLPRKMQAGASFSLRFKGIRLTNTWYSNLYWGIRHFPSISHSIMARLSYVKTDFTTGYRPTITHRMAITRKIRLNSTMGAYIYDTGGITSESYYADFQLHFSLARHYYFSSTFRRFFDTNLRSNALSAELGVQF